MRHLFVINPVAGKKDSSEQIMSEARRLFRYRGDVPEFYVTRAPKDAITKVRAEALAGAAAGEELRVYACGGDGTLNECVNGAAGLANCAVTHLPTGTGNDFLRTFGAEKEKFRKMELLVDGVVRPLDVIDCNGRYSIAVCSVGLDARIGTRVHQYSDIPIVGNKLGYVISLGANLIEGVTDPMNIFAGETNYRGDVNLCCVCNGTSYGGGFTPVGEARPDDGILDVLIVHDVNRMNIMRIVLDYAKGKYAKYPQYIIHERTDSVHMEFDKPMDINIDGELMRSETVDISLVKGGVNFIFPKKMRYFSGKEISE